MRLQLLVFIKLKICSYERAHRVKRNVGYCSWTIFTTNYDTCLEYFWREYVRETTYTGFVYDEKRQTQVLDSSYKGGSDLNLVKLHGSLNWMIEPDGSIIEEAYHHGGSFIGRTYKGPMMIYPIQQKELYVEPFISMFGKLNEELKRQNCWIIVGYSFNDPIIREIYLRNSTEEKKIIFLHPHADDIIQKHLNGIEGNVISIEQYFGLENFHSVNSLIHDALRSF